MPIHDDQQAEAEKELRDTQERERNLRIEREQVIQALMQHQGGRNFLWWFLDLTNVIGGQPFAGVDTHLTSFYCGAAEPGRRLLDEIMRAAPNAFADLMKEKYHEQRIRRESKSEPDSEPGGPPSGPAEPEPDTYA